MFEAHLPKDMKVRNWWIGFYGNRYFRDSFFDFAQ